MQAIHKILIAVAGTSLLIGCANQTQAPVLAAADPAVDPNPAVYASQQAPEAQTAAEQSPPAAAAPSTQPVAGESALPPGYPQLKTGASESAPGALPQGHPPIGQQQSNEQMPALPEGHPAIGQGAPQQGAGDPAGTLPKGHPPIGGAAGAAPAGGMGGMGGAMPGLPSGHPDIAKSQQATTQPARFGTLTIKAQQSTSGGPAVGADAVTVEIYQGSKLMKTAKGQLNPGGTQSIADVPFGSNYQQVVKIEHGGVEYSAAADPTKADQTVTVPVYETTEQAPAWQIKMRHVIVQPVEGGVQVMEMLAVDNPTDRSWIGAADAAGKRNTFNLTLPAGVKDVQLMDGFHDCCVKIDQNKLINSMALVPGTTRYQVAYTVPVNNGKSEITATAAAPVKAMMVILPDDGATVKAEGLEGPQTVDMGNGPARFFRGLNLPANKEVKLTVAVQPAAKKGAAAAGMDSSKLARVIAGAGGLLVFVVGGAFMFFKAPRSAKKAR